jgi:hypothetical protein
LYLAEGIGAIIEVKSNIVSQWREVESTTRMVKSLIRQFGSMMSFGNPPQPRIPVFAVGYEGYRTIDSIKLRLMRTDSLAQPDGVLVIEPGLFVGEGIECTGSLALYGFIVNINTACTTLISAMPDYFSYAR